MIPNNNAPSHVFVAPAGLGRKEWVAFLLLSLCALAGAFLLVWHSTARPKEVFNDIRAHEKRSENPALVDPVSQSTKDVQDQIEDALVLVSGVCSATASVRLPQDGYAPPIRAAVTLEMKPGAHLTSKQRSDVTNLVYSLVNGVARENVAIYVHERFD